MIWRRLGTGLFGSGLLGSSLVISDGNVAVLGVWSLGRAGLGDLGEDADRGELGLEGRVSGDNGVEDPEDNEATEDCGEVTVTVVGGSIFDGSGPGGSFEEVDGVGDTDRFGEAGVMAA